MVHSHNVCPGRESEIVDWRKLATDAGVVVDVPDAQGLPERVDDDQPWFVSLNEPFQSDYAVLRRGPKIKAKGLCLVRAHEPKMLYDF